MQKQWFLREPVKRSFENTKISFVKNSKDSPVLMTDTERGDGFGAASFYYGPNGANKYNQATIDRVNIYMYQLIKAREIEYTKHK